MTEDGVAPASPGGLGPSPAPTTAAPWSLRTLLQRQGRRPVHVQQQQRCLQWRVWWAWVRRVRRGHRPGKQCLSPSSGWGRFIQRRQQPTQRERWGSAAQAREGGYSQPLTTGDAVLHCPVHADDHEPKDQHPRQQCRSKLLCRPPYVF